MTNIVSLAKSIVELAAGINNANLAKQVSELTIAVAQSEIEKAQLIKENAELKEQNRVLSEDREAPLLFDNKDRRYYLRDDTERMAPFCPHCYEAERIRIHLTEKDACPHCGKDFSPPPYFKDIMPP
jgi:glutaredoxin